MRLWPVINWMTAAGAVGSLVMAADSTQAQINKAIRDADGTNKTLRFCADDGSTKYFARYT